MWVVCHGLIGRLGFASPFPPFGEISLNLDWEKLPTNEGRKGSKAETSVNLYLNVGDHIPLQGAGEGVWLGICSTLLYC